MAHSLVNSVEEEIDSVKKCFECYSKANENPSGWVTMVCTRPHLVIWAKVNSYNHWPGKLMTINERTGTINVRFFGDHTYANVPASKCFLYSEKSPTTSPKRSVLYRRALKVSFFLFFNRFNVMCAICISSGLKHHLVEFCDLNFYKIRTKIFLFFFCSRKPMRTSKIFALNLVRIILPKQELPSIQHV